MILLVTQIINQATVAIQNIFLYASFVGYLIVLVLTTVSSFLINLFESVILFFQIVYEDNVTIFTEELPGLAHTLIGAVLYQCQSLQNLLLMLVDGLINKLNNAISNILWTIDAVTLIIVEVFLFWKNVIIFLGDSLWLVLTFLPVHLPYLIKAFVKSVVSYIVNTFVNVTMAFLRLSNFLSDVPLESFIGITTTMIIIRLCVYYREILQVHIFSLYWVVKRKCLYLYYGISNYFNDPEVRIIGQLTREALLTSEADVSPSNVDDAADALCVICQERQKCVLTLPCRHVCLCSECCIRLYGYQRTCPICRTFIYHSVTVYL